jgi:hypothetical protein
MICSSPSNGRRPRYRPALGGRVALPGRRTDEVTWRQKPLNAYNLP